MEGLERFLCEQLLLIIGISLLVATVSTHININNWAKEHMSNNISQEDRHRHDLSTLWLGGLYTLGITLTICGVLMALSIREENQEMDKLLSKSKTYTVYVNGTIVDANTIDISKYSLDSIRVDDSESCIYITVP